MNNNLLVKSEISKLNNILFSSIVHRFTRSFCCSYCLKSNADARRGTIPSAPIPTRVHPICTTIPQRCTQHRRFWSRRTPTRWRGSLERRPTSRRDLLAQTSLLSSVPLPCLPLSSLSLPIILSPFILLVKYFQIKFVYSKHNCHQSATLSK